MASASHSKMESVVSNLLPVPDRRRGGQKQSLLGIPIQSLRLSWSRESDEADEEEEEEVVQVK